MVSSWNNWYVFEWDVSFTADLRHGDALFPCEEEKSSRIRKENEIITQKRRDPRAILDVLIAKSLERIEKVVWMIWKMFYRYSFRFHKTWHKHVIKSQTKCIFLCVITTKIPWSLSLSSLPMWQEQVRLLPVLLVLRDWSVSTFWILQKLQIPSWVDVLRSVQ